jgi:hypothetical protein
MSTEEPGLQQESSADLASGAIVRFYSAAYGKFLAPQRGKSGFVWLGMSETPTDWVLLTLAPMGSGSFLVIGVANAVDRSLQQWVLGEMNRVQIGPNPQPQGFGLKLQNGASSPGSTPVMLSMPGAGPFMAEPADGVLEVVYFGDGPGLVFELQPTT